MKTKIIPFDLEMAKKIQAGEIKGRIVQNNGLPAAILAFDINGENLAVRFTGKDGTEGVSEYKPNGKVLSEWCSGSEEFALAIELLEEAPIDNDRNHGFCRFIPNPNHREGVMGDYSLAPLNENESINIFNSSVSTKRELKPFDKVLVRDMETGLWLPRLYGYYIKEVKEHCCQNGMLYKECIPYEGNEHLVGTIDKPKED